MSSERRRAGPTPATLQETGSLDELGPEWDAAFAAGPGFQSSRAWFAASVEAALPPGVRPLFLQAREGGSGRPLLLLPMLAGPGQRVQSMTTPYTCLFQPLSLPGVDAAVQETAWAAVGRALRAWPSALLEAMDPGWAGLPPMLAGLRRAGIAVRRYDHFGNWHEAVQGGWEGYLASREGRLRETIRRRTRAASRGGTRIEVVEGGPGLAPALAAYEDVYARSWKSPEPFPRFNAALLRRAATAGVLRLGVMWDGGEPVAAQYWTVCGGTATVLKLAHDDQRRSLSPGTVLLAHMIRRLLDDEGVSELDFGRGDDSYKAAWVRCRRQRVGFLLANPARPGGLANLLRNDISVALRRLRRAVTRV